MFNCTTCSIQVKDCFQLFCFFVLDNSQRFCWDHPNVPSLASQPRLSIKDMKGETAYLVSASGEKAKLPKSDQKYVVFNNDDVACVATKGHPSMPKCVRRSSSTDGKSQVRMRSRARRAKTRTRRERTKSGGLRHHQAPQSSPKDPKTETKERYPREGVAKRRQLKMQQRLHKGLDWKECEARVVGDIAFLQSLRAERRYNC